MRKSKKQVYLRLLAWGTDRSNLQEPVRLRGEMDKAEIKITVCEDDRVLAAIFESLFAHVVTLDRYG
jgi:hypothetical protein